MEKATSSYSDSSWSSNTVTEHNVIFCADDGYAAHLGTAIYSLLINNRGLPVTITVLTSDMSPKNQARLGKICGNFSTPFRIEFVQEGLFSDLVLRNHLTTSTYFRLLAPDFIKSQKCLYLDSDVLVVGSIAELFEYDLNDYYLAAVKNPGFQGHPGLGMSPSSHYFNAGVMVMNLSKWRKHGIRNLVFEFTLANSAAILHADQCGLNAVIDGDWLGLRDDFNLQTATRKADETSRMQPIIVHFTGNSKPWHTNNFDPFKRVYWSYRNKTPFRALLPDDFGPRVLLSRLSPRPLKKLLAKFAH